MMGFPGTIAQQNGHPAGRYLNRIWTANRVTGIALMRIRGRTSPGFRARTIVVQKADAGH